MTTNEKRMLEELGIALGEDPAKISLQLVNWTSYMEKGVIVKLIIRRWRAKTKLSLDDMGLIDQYNERDINELINLGDKYLLPPDLLRQLESVETSARYNVEKHGFKTYWGWFIPEKAYPDWKAENKLWKDRYYDIRDKIIRDYDQNRSELLTAYRQAARLAYRRIKALKTTEMTIADRLDEDTFVGSFVTRLSDMILTPDQIYASFDYQEDLQYIPLPSILQKDFIARDKIRDDYQRQKANEDFKSILENDMISKANEQKEQLIGGFLSDVAGQLRSMVYNASTDILSSIKRNGNLQPRSVIQLKRLIDQIESLNFIDDKEIQSMIDKMKSIVDQDSSKRSDNIDAISNNLADIANITRATLLAFGEKPRTPKGQSLKALGVMPVPDKITVKACRNRLIQPDLEIEIPEIGRTARKTM